MFENDCFIDLEVGELWLSFAGKYLHPIVFPYKNVSPISQSGSNVSSGHVWGCAKIITEIFN